MTVTAAAIASRADSISNSASGSFTGDGNVTTITLGFTPLQVIVFNSTDAIKYEKIAGMLGPDSIKTAANGTQTCDTGSAILISGGVVTLATGVAINAKAIAWYARR